MTSLYRVKAEKLKSARRMAQFDKVIEVDREQGQLTDDCWNAWLYGNFWPIIISTLDPRLDESVRIIEVEKLPCFVARPRRVLT